MFHQAPSKALSKAMSKEPSQSSSRRVAQSLAIFTSAALSLTLLSGCSAAAPKNPSEDSSESSVSMKPVAEAAALVPTTIRESGILRVAIPTNEPPTQYYKEGTKVMIGLNPDIARLIAAALDLDIEIVVSNFDSIIPGLGANRFDMTVSSMTPTAARLEVLDFVDYVQMGSGLAVQKGNPEKIGFDALCGKEVAMLTGSYQLTTYVPEMNAACLAAGQKEIVVGQFQDTRQAISALTSGRASVVFADSPILDYADKQSEEIEITDRNSFDAVSVGIPKTLKMVDAVSAALDIIITSPEYQQVLNTYGLEASAITDARVNFEQ